MGAMRWIDRGRGSWGDSALEGLLFHPCTGFIHCGYKGLCAQKNEVAQIRQMILELNMLVFTPLYYYGMSAQFKTFIDRFCAFNGSIQQKRIKSAPHIFILLI